MRHTIPFTAALAAALLAGCAPNAPVATTPAAPDPRFAVTDTKNYNPFTVNVVPSDPPTAKLAYGTASPKQAGELRMPQGKGPFALVVLWHGGCWSGMGNTANVAALASFLARNGIAVWTPSYRDLGSKGGWPETFTDWAQGLSFVNTIAKTYPVDVKRITLMGHSAGTTPAVWLASGNKGDAVIAGELPRVQAVAVLDGPLALAPFVGTDAAICGMPVIAPLLGGTPAEQPTRYAILDPLQNRPLVKRMLVVDGALPNPDPAMIAALQGQGIKVDLITIDQEQHFNLLVPGTADFAAIGPALLDIAAGR
jgi:pimeloyl-ACP methyl ester carboxylesterase